MTAPLPRTVNPQELDPQVVRLLPYPFAKSKGVLAARAVGSALEVWIRPYPQASTLAEVRRMAGKPLREVLLTAEEFEHCLALAYTREPSAAETIVDDILTAMRFELASARAPAQLPMRRARIPAGEIATAAADRLRARHPERPLELDVPDELPAIDVDPVLLRRVIDNLLENAHKYTPDAGSPIRLAVRRDAGELILEVADRGIGIPADDLPRIFTAFFRGERSRSRETGGVGLGLTLARRIVEAHGGTIDVTSTPNVGTTVRVAIPVG